MHQTIGQRKHQALMRIHSSRVGLIGSVEDTGKVVSTWRDSLPSAQAVGKFSLGIGISWVAKCALEHFVAKRRPVEVAAPVKTSFLRYLLLQGCTLILLPIIKEKMMDGGYKHLGKNMALPKIDTLFYRWLGLEN